MKITQRGVDLIKLSEGCELTAYRDGGGVLTIGVGSTGPHVTEGLTITQAEAEALLLRDLVRFDAAVAEKCPETTPLQHDAMVSLCFNIGPGWKGTKKPKGARDGFRQSSVARLHNLGEYAKAGQAFALWNKDNGVVEKGLVKRRAREAALYLEGTPDDVEQAPIVRSTGSGMAEGEKPLTHSKKIIATGLGTASMALSQVDDAATQFQWMRDLFGELLPYLPQISTGFIIAGIVALAVGVYFIMKDRREGRS